MLLGDARWGQHLGTKMLAQHIKDIYESLDKFRLIIVNFVVTNIFVGNYLVL